MLKWFHNIRNNCLQEREASNFATQHFTFLRSWYQFLLSTIYTYTPDICMADTIYKIVSCSWWETEIRRRQDAINSAKKLQGVITKGWGTGVL